MTNCPICAIPNRAAIEELNALLEGDTPLNEKSFRRVQKEMKEDFPDLELPFKNIEIHLSHMVNIDGPDAGTLVLLQDDQMFDPVTKELIPFIEPKIALKIIVTLGIRQILRTGGKRISVRYVVEAAKVLSEFGVTDTISDDLNNTWIEMLKSKADKGLPSEFPHQISTGDYSRKVDLEKRKFLEDAGISLSDLTETP